MRRSVSSRIPLRMGRINLERETALSQQTMFSASRTQEDEARLADVREKVRTALQHVPLEAFKRDKQLKAIRERFRQSRDANGLAEELDIFLIDNDLYREIILPKTTLEQVRAEDLQLVAYEVFG